MFRRSTDGIAVPASIRMNDGALLIGAINCGASGRLENLLAGANPFIEYISKDGQQRFIARHQIASIEPVNAIKQSNLAEVANEVDPFEVIGVSRRSSLENAMAAFQRLLKLYNPDRWTGPDVPFEFTRYAAEKTRQLHTAFTAVRAEIQETEKTRATTTDRPLFRLSTRPDRSGPEQA